MYLSLSWAVWWLCGPHDVYNSTIECTDWYDTIKFKGIATQNEPDLWRSIHFV